MENKRRIWGMNGEDYTLDLGKISLFTGYDARKETHDFWVFDGAKCLGYFSRHSGTKIRINSFGIKHLSEYAPVLEEGRGISPEIKLGLTFLVGDLEKEEKLLYNRGISSQNK